VLYKDIQPRFSSMSRFLFIVAFGDSKKDDDAARCATPPVTRTANKQKEQKKKKTPDTLE
jgi:hypothetical protein